MGSYRFMRLLGKGAFAEVWLSELLFNSCDVSVGVEVTSSIIGQHTRCCDNDIDASGIVSTTNKLVAIKVSNEFESNLIKEAAFLSKFDHPNLIKLISVCSVGVKLSGEVTRGNVLELLEGPDLSTQVENGKTVNEGKVASYMRFMTSALSYLTGMSVVHGDINLANMVLDSGGRVLKLIDFGNARTVDVDNFRSYKDPAFLCDLEMLGRCALELLTGQTIESTGECSSWLKSVRSDLSKSEEELLEKGHKYFQPDYSDRRLSQSSINFIRLLLKLESDYRRLSAKTNLCRNVAVKYELTDLDDLYKLLFNHKFLTINSR